MSPVFKRIQKVSGVPCFASFVFDSYSLVSHVSSSFCEKEISMGGRWLTGHRDKGIQDRDTSLEKEIKGTVIMSPSSSENSIVVNEWKATVTTSVMKR